ncbi:MAG: hypothetical protein KDB70_04965 [Mycobacterium sp.]|nr:hypothetical protein [Mycobacterium sp.]
MTTLPFATASQSWATWAGDVDTLGNDLDPESLMSGLDGGPFDRILADLHAVKTNTAALALAASDLSGECKTQDLYDRALAQAPTPGQVREAEKAAAEVVLRRKYGATERAGDQAIVNRARNLREERNAAVEQHRQDTARTTLTQPPARSVPAAAAVPGFAPSSTATSEPPWGDEADPDTAPVGTDLSSASTKASPTPGLLASQHAGTQTPQQTTATTPTTMPGFTPTTPTVGSPIRSRRRGRDGDDEDTRDLPDGATETDDITPEPGTDLAADRGGVRHGTSLSDTSGRPTVSPYGAVTAQPVAATGTAHTGYGAGGMPMMGGMGAGHSGERSGSGKRPEVLSNDPEGRRGDEYAFEGGLVSTENPEEQAFLEWISAEDREAIERRMNPHVVGQR